MIIKSLFLSMLLGLTVINIHSYAQPQTGTPTPKHLLREDSAAVNALVLYPDTIRLDIFEVSEFPASVVSIATLQKNTSSDFANLISSYSKGEQEDLWNLSRYPDLISKLVAGGEKSKDQINDILADYPQDIYDEASKYGRSHYDILLKMDQLQANTNAQFEQILADYPPSTQEALRELIRYPEIINLLNDHLGLTVRVGDRYRRDPQSVVRWADSLNLVEVRQNAQNAEEWKQNIDQNPDAANDLKKAADEYAKENGYSDDDINATPDPDYVSNYTCAPYYYWFGYPTWYPYAYWYPYPFWFDCGFFYSRGHMVIIGTPSFYFTNWYFYYPDHWHHYPYLCNGYISHYYGHRTLPTSNTVIVHNWVRDNRNYLPKGFISDNSRRVETIRQVAQLNMDAQKEQGGRPVTPSTRDQYFKNNAVKYPALNTNPQTRMPVQPERQNLPNILQQPEKQPPVRIPKAVQQQPSQTPKPIQQQPTQAPKSLQQPAGNTRRPDYNFNNINKAQELHKSVWQQAAPPPQPVQRPQPAQRPQTQPSQPARQAPMSTPAPAEGGRKK